MKPQNQNNDFQLIFKALSYVKTHWWLFALEAIAIYGFWLISFARTPNIYESRASILIDTSRREMYQSMFSSGRRRREATKKNMVHLLRSHEVMQRFGDQLTQYFNEEERPAHLRLFFPNGKAYPPNVLASWVTLTWDKNSDIYYLRCIAQNPDAAHDLCKVYLETLRQAYPEIGQRGIQAKLEFLGRQVSSLSKQIVDRELEIAEFEKKNTDFINFITAIIENKSLQELRTKTLELKQKIRINDSIKNMMVEEPLAKSPAPQSYEETRQALSTRLSELLFREHLTEHQASHDKNDRLTTIRKEIALVSRQIKEINEAQTSSLSNNPFSGPERQKMLVELEMQQGIDRIKLQNLQQEIKAVEAQKGKYREVELQYSRLKSELDHKVKLLANLYKKEQESEIELSAARSEVFSLNQPTRNGNRIEPQLSKHVFAGTSVTIFAILITLILLLTFFPRLDTEADVQKLNLPILGKIPVFKEWFGNVNSLNPFALEYLKIMSYRILRETKANKCPVAIVTSPQAGEGKSTVTYFLTLASKSPGRKVLFIDGDLLTAHPNSFFGIPEDQTEGLKAIVEAPTDTPLTKDLIVETRHEGVHFLPRGGRAESVSAPNFLAPVLKQLDKLREEYDIIFIDTPPLFASSLAHQWAGIGDLVVLVARMFQTRPRDITEALQTCKIFSKAPVGVALNCLPLHNRRGRGSYYYYFSRKHSRAAA